MVGVVEKLLKLLKIFIKTFKNKQMKKLENYTESEILLMLDSMLSYQMVIEIVDERYGVNFKVIKTANAITIISKWCKSITYDRQIDAVDEKEPKYIYDKTARTFWYTDTLDEFASEMHDVFQEIIEVPFEEN